MCPICEGNPARLACTCSKYKLYGICPHVLAINHILKEYNVRHQLRKMGQSNRKSKSNKLGTGGNQMHPLPALQKDPALNPDSSDEEEAQQQELGLLGL